jgi:hypothetical protein
VVVEPDVPKPTNDVDALLIRIRTLKWQAVTVTASSSDGLAREDAAALIATLDGIVMALGKDLAPEALEAAEARLDRLAKSRDHEPRHRSAGQS